VSHSLAVIVPTIGRPSLAGTLASLEGLASEDKVIVIADGPVPEAQDIFADAGLPGGFVALPWRTNDHGGTPRQVGMECCPCDYLWFLDDDDRAAPDALEAIHREIDQGPICPRVFRMARGHPHNDTLWTVPSISYANVSSQMYVVPAVPALRPRWGRWSKRYGHDLDFLASLAALWLGRIEWLPDVVAWWNWKEGEHHAR
jgi:glycosyltransferase involved in cell wall biosynthesis